MIHNIQFGDKVRWEEGSQMDKQTHTGIVVSVKTVVKVAVEGGEIYEVDIEDLERGWRSR